MEADYGHCGLPCLRREGPRRRAPLKRMMVNFISHDARALRLARTVPASMMSKLTAYFCRAFS